MFVEFLLVAFYTTLFTSTDRWMTSCGLHKPYYAVHVLHNALIVGLTGHDVVRCFTLGSAALHLPTQWVAILLCYGLHLYHILEY